MIKTKRLFKNFFAKKRGISPVLAAILMVGLTVVSGAILYSVSNAFLSQETQVDLILDDDSTVFKTSETDFKFADDLIDTISVQIENPLTEPVLVSFSQTYLYNASDDTKLSGWGVLSDSKEIVLSGKESATITFGTNVLSDDSELIDGSEVYAVFKCKLYGSDNQFTALKTNTFTVELTSQEPLFQALPVISATQTEDTLFFAGEDEDEVKVNLTLALFNFGNSAESYEKSVSITLENETIFAVEEGYETQIVTVPSAQKGGDFGALGFCEADEACVNVTFPITKFNLTDVGITSLATYDFGAIISISGLELMTYQLTLSTPEFKIALENGRWRRSNVRYNTITFDERINRIQTVDFTVNVWNLLDTTNSGTFELYDFNTTVFEVASTSGQRGRWWRWNRYDSNPVDLTFREGPGQRFDRCRSRDACESIDWGLSRLPLIDGDGNPTGIEAGIYSAKIREIRTGQILEIQLVVSEFMTPIHVDDFTAEKQGKKNNYRIDLTVEIRDEDGNPVRNAVVYITWKMPDGSTELIDLKTNWRGIASKQVGKAEAGTHTFTVDDVQKESRWGWWRNRVSLWPYEPADNLVTFPITVNI